MLQHQSNLKEEATIFIYFLYKNGIAVPRKVESGVRTEDKVQIISGIYAGDTVITSGIMQIRPRAKVKIISIEK